MKNPYEENGYKNRIEYLKSVAEDFDVPYRQVEAIASILGPEEDFDGLITFLEDENA